MSAEFVRNEIYKYLVGLGLNKFTAAEASDKGVEFYNRGNLKDPYSEALRHAGVYAESRQEGFKFKLPKKVTGKPFSYSKPKSRKHQKNQDAMF